MNNDQGDTIKWINTVAYRFLQDAGHYEELMLLVDALTAKYEKPVTMKTPADESLDSSQL